MEFEGGLEPGLQSSEGSQTPSPGNPQGGHAHQPVRMRKKPVTKSSRAGLTFPVGRIRRKLKESVAAKERVSDSAAVYVTAVLEYFCQELLDMAVGVCEGQQKKQITPRHLLLAIRGDKELDTFVTATIAGGGVIPYIHEDLLKKGPKSGKKPGRKPGKKPVAKPVNKPVAKPVNNAAKK